MWMVFALCMFIWMQFVISVSATEGRCMCDIDGFWRAENLFECQRVSDLLISVAYFSIPVELLYFISCSNVPFKWVLSQFIAFIVLCGMTHLLNTWTYAPHSFRLMLAVTVFKFLTALVSFATAITLFTIFPLLLKIKRREIMLRKKTWDLDREVGLIKRRRETGWHVRMLTQEIRKSLDKHTILYTTLVELSETLDLKNCAVWMPNEERTNMNLTHELKGRNFHNQTVPITDPDVVQTKRTDDGVNILNSDSALGAASSGGGIGDAGAIAAIRMPMLRVSDFKGGTPEMIQTCYAILVLVLPNTPGRSWTKQELEIVKVVADQVAVALSHAAVLEESQLMREKLVEQNRALLQAKRDAMMANEARNSFQKVLSTSMRRPMHSVSGLLSMLQDEKMSSDQQIIVDAISKSNEVLSTLVTDLMDMSFKKNGPFSLNTRAFKLHSLIKEAACLLKCLCAYWGFDFSIDVERSLPDNVMGDERRIFQIIMHMFGSIINSSYGNGAIAFRIFSETGSRGSTDQKWATWRSNVPDGYLNVRFEIDFNNHGSQWNAQSSTESRTGVGRLANDKVNDGLSFVICKKIVQLMHGNIWAVPSHDGYDRSMALTLRLHLKQSLRRSISDVVDIADHSHSSNSLFKGIQILVADEDDTNRVITRRLLEKLGCSVSAVSSGHECLSSLGLSVTPFRIIIIDLHMTDLDGYELALRIRQFQSHNCPLIIALTSVSDDDVWERCMQTGINGVVLKPVSGKCISDELKRVLRLT